MTTAKTLVLQLSPFPFPQISEALAQQFNVIELWKADDPQAVIQAHGADVLGLVTSALTSTPASLIDQLPKLQVICSLGVGYDSIDVQHAQQKGIPVSNTPDVLNDCVADLAWGLMLATARNIGHAERYARAGLWESGPGFPLATRVSRKKLGIVGLGRIGIAIAQRAAGFNMDIRYHNRRQRDDVSYGYEPELTKLATWADFLMIATVGGDSTRHLIGQKELEALGPQGILINISRGSVIDETALITALQQGTIQAAGLDVYESEPHIPVTLRSLDNVVILPHIASATQETRYDMANLVVQNLTAYFHEGKLLTPVPPL